MSPDLLAPAFALLGAASWGAGDYCGGLAARRAALPGVLAVAYLGGAALVVLLALATGEPLPAPRAVGWAMAAAVAGTLGLAALYRGLAVGRMALVAPVSAVLSAAGPVLVGVAADGLPAAHKLVGFALALLGIWLVARSGAAAVDRLGLALGLGAGAAFGAFLVFMHLAADGAGPFWPLAASRATSIVLVVGFARWRGARPVPPREALGLALLTGVLDAGGNAGFVLASHLGRLDVAAVLSSMYPVATLALAAALLGERVSRAQAVGIAAVLAAIALISA